MYIKNAVRNVLVNVSGQIFVLILNFISRKIFLMILDANYLGISGLFSSVVTILSLTELGIGTAITFSLYKPLVKNDNILICSVMNMYKKIYRCIGIVVLILGIAITPVVMYMTELDGEIPHLKSIYILFVLNSSITYFYSYSRTLIVADQKEYRLAKIDYVGRLLLIILQVAVLVITENYLLYLLVQIFMTFGQNYLVYRKIRKLYPTIWTGEAEKIPEHVLKEIKRNTLAMMIYKLAVVIVSGTDNLIISKCLGTIWVGLYSNYSMIILAVQTICDKLINSVTASIGNIVAMGDKEYSYQIYEVMQYICFLIYGTSTIMMFVLIPPFINTFFGEQYLISMETLVVILLNFYLLGMQGASAQFRDVQGIFWQGKLRPLVQGILNLLISIILVKHLHNLTAVFWGTVISRIMTVTWLDPYVVHKYGFGELNRIRIFIKKYIKYSCVIILAGLIIHFLLDGIKINSFPALVGIGIISLLIIQSIILLFTFRTPEFLFLFDKVRQLRSSSYEK